MDIQVAQTLFSAVDASLKSSLVNGTSKVMVGLGALIGTMWMLSFTLRSPPVPAISSRASSAASATAKSEG